MSLGQAILYDYRKVLATVELLAYLTEKLKLEPEILVFHYQFSTFE